MIQWKTGRPSGAIIVAKLTERFTYSKDFYEVLYYQEKLQHYYDNEGEKVPFGAIEKWALIKE